jgi:RNA polymerase sigma-70 factor (ECF subfamily)
VVAVLGAEFPPALDGARSGDSACFELLYRDLQPALLRYLRTVAPEQAEDAAAETWTQVLRSWQQFTGDEPGFRSWVFTIARNKVIDWQRQSARRPTIPLTPEHEDRMLSPDPLALVELDDAAERTVAMLGLLAPDQAEAVLLRSIVGLSVAETAEVMNRSEGAVRVLSHRGLKRLAGLLTSVMGKGV